MKRECKKCGDNYPHYYFSLTGCVCYDCRLGGEADPLSPSPTSEGPRLREQVKRFLSAELTDRQTHVAALVIFDGLTTGEAASECEISQPRVVEILRATRRRLLRVGLVPRNGGVWLRPDYVPTNPLVMSQRMVDPRAKSPLEAAMRHDIRTPLNELLRRRIAWESSRKQRADRVCKCAETWCPVEMESAMLELCSYLESLKQSSPTTSPPALPQSVM